MSDKIFEYTDRGEATLENLLIWWGTLKVESSATSSTTELICFEDTPMDFPYSIEATSFCLSRAGETAIPTTFTDHSRKRPVSIFLEPGDKIYYSERQDTLTVMSPS